MREQIALVAAAFVMGACGMLALAYSQPPTVEELCALDPIGCALMFEEETRDDVAPSPTLGQHI